MCGAGALKIPREVTASLAMLRSLASYIAYTSSAVASCRRLAFLPQTSPLRSALTPLYTYIST